MPEGFHLELSKKKKPNQNKKPCKKSRAKDSVSEEPAMHAQRPAFNPLDPVKLPRVMAHAYNCCWRRGDRMVLWAHWPAIVFKSMSPKDKGGKPEKKTYEGNDL